MQDIVEPIRTLARMLIDEPSWEKSSTDIEEPKRAVDRIDIEEPKLVYWRIDILPPNREVHLILMELPKCTKFTRDTEPSRDVPVMDNPLPTRPRQRKLREEPICTKSIIDAELPNRRVARMLSVEPMFTKPKIDTSEPISTCPEMDVCAVLMKLEPPCLKSPAIDIEEPKRAIARRLIELPRLLKSRTLSAEPNRDADRSDTELPR
jgi:hypothetical protein